MIAPSDNNRRNSDKFSDNKSRGNQKNAGYTAAIAPCDQRTRPTEYHRAQRRQH